MTEQIKGQMSIFDFLDQGSWFGKMYPEHSVLTEAKILEPSSKRPQKWSKGMPAYLELRGGRDGHLLDASWEMGGALLGEYTMHSFGEYPKEENVSLLSQILEDNPLPKYSLSAKACLGILRRAEKRGKVLPTVLKEALERQSAFKNEQVVMGGAKESSYNMNEQEHCQHLTTKACCKGADMYNQSLTGDVAMSITGAATDSHHIPCVVESQGQLCYSLDEKMGNTYIGEDMGNTLSARDYKQPQAVFDTRGNGDGNTVLTLTGDNNRRVTKMTTCVVDTEAVCYRGDSITNPVNQSNPKVGDPCHTLTNDDRNYVVMAMQAIGEYKESDQASALKQRDYKDATDLVVYGLDRASFNQGQNALYDFSVEEEKAQTLVAKGPGGVLAKLSEHYAQEISRE